MPDLGEFARRIRVLASRIGDNTDVLVRRTAIAVNQTVVLATPVDTGRARANWQVGIGEPVREELDKTDPGGGDTIGRNNMVIGRRRSEEVIYLSNNLDYIGALNRGSSSQAPAGFVEEAVATGAAVVRQTRVVRR